MADKQKFVGDFRTAVSEALIAIDKLDNLCAICDDLSWVEADFTGLTGEITATEFFAAITEWEAVSTAFETSIAALTKLRA